MIYLISDIHGMYDAFMKMLVKINFNINDKMYIIGDVVDRGNEPIQCLQYVMAQSNMEMLLGNHEDMMLKTLVNGDKGYYSCWMNNGGGITLSQYDLLDNNSQLDILEYLRGCKLTKVIDKYILVHAGVDTSLCDSDEVKTIDDFLGIQDTETILWDRQDFKSEPLRDYTIIFGHTPTYYMKKMKPMKIWNSNGRIGIDCGACFNGGQLGCLRLDDMTEYYV